MANTNSENTQAAESSDFITIGIILGTWGLKGAFKVHPTTDFPERFNSGKEVYLNKQPLVIENTLWQKKEVIIKLSSVNTPDDASKLRRKVLEIPSSALHKLPEWQHYQFDIIGLEVCTPNGTSVGRIIEILNCSNDVYVVQSHSKKEILIPATKDIIKSIDLKSGKLTIEPIEGILE